MSHLLINSGALKALWAINVCDNLAIYNYYYSNCMLQHQYDNSLALHKEKYTSVLALAKCKLKATCFTGCATIFM